jgi:hypothetical protein
MSLYQECKRYIGGTELTKFDDHFFVRSESIKAFNKQTSTCQLSTVVAPGILRGGIIEMTAEISPTRIPTDIGSHRALIELEQNALGL